MKHNKYSDLKIFAFPDKIASFQSGKVTAPIYVRIKPINRCNHACHFCLVAGTRVDTPNGMVPIEMLEPNDLVFSPDGNTARIIEKSRRYSPAIVRIGCEGRLLEASPDHPILTESGWTRAEEIRVGTRAVVRVRMRSSSEPISQVVESIFQGASAARGSDSSGTEAHLCENAGEQPDEVYGSSRKSDIEDSRGSSSILCDSSLTCLGSGAATHAIERKSDEKSGDSRSGSSAGSRNPETIEARGALYSMDAESFASHSSDKLGPDVHRSEESGLPNFGSTKSNRIVSADMLQQAEGLSGLDELRRADDRALPEEQMAMLGDISEAKPAVRRIVVEHHARLCISGIELERGLELRSVDSVVFAPGAEVFNFSCEPIEAYEANGFAVHNCTYSDGTKRAKDNPEQHLVTGMHTAMRERDVMPTSKLIELLTDLRDIGAKAITFSGGGEPLMHPDIVPVMEYALSCGLDLSIITNGQALKGERARVLSRAKWVRVSIDYTSAKQMAESRHVPERFFDEVMENLRTFAAMKSAGCDLGVNFIVTRQNAVNDQLVAFAAELKSRGVENVRFSPVYVPDFQNYHAPHAARVSAQLIESQTLADNNFSINSTFDLSSPSKLPVRPCTRCLYMQTVPVVGADLGVYSCHNGAYSDKHRIGSIAAQRFRDLWFSDETRAFFENFNAQKSCANMECANQSKVVLFNQLADSSTDNFV